MGAFGVCWSSKDSDLGHCSSSPVSVPLARLRASLIAREVLFLGVSLGVGDSECSRNEQWDLSLGPTLIGVSKLCLVCLGPQQSSKAKDEQAFYVLQSHLLSPVLGCLKADPWTFICWVVGDHLHLSGLQPQRGESLCSSGLRQSYFIGFPASPSLMW